MTNATDDLLADLDAEFGKKKKEKTNIKAKLSGSRFTSGHAAVNVNDALEANAYAKNFDGKEWKPICRLTYIVKQHCKCCDCMTEYIGGEFVRLKHRRAHLTVDRRAETCTEWLHFGIKRKGVDEGKDAFEMLPVQTDYFEQFVHACVSCIRAERTVEEIWQYVSTKPEANLELDFEV